jgi:DNA-binding MarR family transcriptional regulator
VPTLPGDETPTERVSAAAPTDHRVGDTVLLSNNVSLEQFDGHLVGGGGRIIARLAKHVELALEDVGLSMAQYRLLSWLEPGDEAAVGLAERMAVTPPSITALVDGLVKRGYVDRVPDPSDRRRLPLHLTAEGATVLRSADAAVEARLEGVKSHLTERSHATAAKGLLAWEVGLDRARAAKTAKSSAAVAR